MASLDTIPETIDPAELGLLNEHETAFRLGLSVKTLRRWRWEGSGVPYVKVGRAVRYDPQDIGEYIQQNRVDKRMESDPDNPET